VVVIAGPGTVRTREELLVAARIVKESGGAILRAGCFRSEDGSPLQSVQGLKHLEVLVEAGREYDLPVATEVVDAADVERVAASADLLEIGGRNMQNWSLLRAAGRQSRPVLLKRGMSSTLEELLRAAEEVLAQGNQQVILCERGIRTFETTYRNTLDLSAVPLLKKLSHLPVAVDPSHVSGGPDWVLPLALAAVAVGAQALILEVTVPVRPGVDGGEALLAGDFAELMRRLYQKA
jgi:3-deoxy-7-phosphoheptulonate synthase